MSEEKIVHCSVCDTDVNVDERGGITGYWGIIPVAFCEWCTASMVDMVDYLNGNGEN